MVPEFGLNSASAPGRTANANRIIPTWEDCFFRLTTASLRHLTSLGFGPPDSPPDQQRPASQGAQQALQARGVTDPPSSTRPIAARPREERLSRTLPAAQTSARPQPLPASHWPAAVATDSPDPLPSNSTTQRLRGTIPSHSPFTIYSSSTPSTNPSQGFTAPSGISFQTAARTPYNIAPNPRSSPTTARPQGRPTSSDVFIAGRQAVGSGLGRLDRMQTTRPSHLSAPATSTSDDKDTSKPSQGPVPSVASQGGGVAGGGTTISPPGADYGSLGK